MDLIERYVLEVEEHLPYKTGSDVAAGPMSYKSPHPRAPLSPLESMAVNARRAPSGDRAKPCRLAAPSNANPVGGRTSSFVSFGASTRSFRCPASQ